MPSWRSASRTSAASAAIPEPRPSSETMASATAPAAPAPAPARPLPPPGSARAWLLAIRPRTLSASVAPVAVGASLAAALGGFHAPSALAALAGALLIQIGTNLANDVLDFHKGADTAERLGPTRVTAAGLLAPRTVALGAAGAFAGAVLVGLYLVARGGLPILVIGLASLACGYLYTGGPHPLAYRGLGDLFVLLFFGLIAVAGTVYVQTGAWSLQALLLGLSVGALSVTILTANNLRDRATDALAGKRTLIVRLGDGWGRRYFAATVGLAFALPALMALLGLWRPGSAGSLGPRILLVLLALPLARPPLAQVRAGAAGRQLLPVLGQTARLQLWHAALLCAGLLWEAWSGMGIGD